MVKADLPKLPERERAKKERPTSSRRNVEVLRERSQKRVAERNARIAARAEASKKRQESMRQRVRDRASVREMRPSGSDKRASPATRQEVRGSARGASQNLSSRQSARKSPRTSSRTKTSLSQDIFKDIKKYAEKDPSRTVTQSADGVYDVILDSEGKETNRELREGFAPVPEKYKGMEVQRSVKTRKDGTERAMTKVIDYDGNVVYQQGGTIPGEPKPPSAEPGPVPQSAGAQGEASEAPEAPEVSAPATRQEARRPSRGASATDPSRFRQPEEREAASATDASRFRQAEKRDVADAVLKDDDPDKAKYFRQAEKREIAKATDKSRFRQATRREAASATDTTRTRRATVRTAASGSYSEFKSKEGQERRAARAMAKTRQRAAAVYEQIKSGKRSKDDPLPAGVLRRHVLAAEMRAKNAEDFADPETSTANKPATRDMSPSAGKSSTRDMSPSATKSTPVQRSSSGSRRSSPSGAPASLGDAPAVHSDTDTTTQKLTGTADLRINGLPMGELSLNLEGS